MILLIPLIDAESHVWYPQYGSWFIVLLAEVLLFLLRLGQEFPRSVFEYAQLTIQPCRALLLMSLPLSFFFRQIDGISKADEESSPLLGQDNTRSPNAAPSNGILQYGTIGFPAAGANVQNETKMRKRKDEEQQKWEGKLEESGNWFRYGDFQNYTPYKKNNRSQIYC